MNDGRSTQVEYLSFPRNENCNEKNTLSSE